MKAIEVACSACGAVLKAPETAVGRKGKCPKCGAVLEIAPSAGAAASGEPPLSTSNPQISSRAEAEQVGSAGDSAFGMPVTSAGSPVNADDPDIYELAAEGSGRNSTRMPRHSTPEQPVGAFDGTRQVAPVGARGDALTEVDLIEEEDDLDVDEGEAEPIVRDRIVVLGRTRSGKTVYLSVLYDKLWNSLDGLSMKAVSGTVHSDLVRIAAGLREGRWPAATSESQHLDIELTYKRQKRMLVALDYAGELFRKTFVEDVTDTPEAGSLLEHIDKAAAVVMLMDPDNAVHGNVDARTDDDYGLSQAVSRIRKWPGGQDVPVVLVFTKSDASYKLVKEHGGLAAFVKKFYPALARNLQKVQIFQVSAVQVAKDTSGKLVPRPDSKPLNLEQPLVYCLDYLAEQVRAREELEELRRRREATQSRREQAERLVRVIAEQEERAAMWTRFKFIAIIVAMCFLALLITLWLLMPSS